MRIQWTKRAGHNLEDVEAYIARDNPEAAVRTVLKIVRAVERLAHHPNIGKPGRVSGTRELVVAGTPYLVPYRIRGDVVEVLRVLHGAMRWPRK